MAGERIAALNAGLVSTDVPGNAISNCHAWNGVNAEPGL